MVEDIICFCDYVAANLSQIDWRLTVVIKVIREGYRITCGTMTFNGFRFSVLKNVLGQVSSSLPIKVGDG